ncbi:restriction endonuclease [Haloplanus rubicundus]|nr:restriction endonuclease [Haloplanus rubicundus]
MDDDRFEHFVADLWEEMGYRTSVRSFSGDAGIDVLARKRGPIGATKAIQVKRYGDSSTVGGPEIQQYFAMKYQVGADEGLIVTTGQFTAPARDRAEELGVRLVNCFGLRSLIENHASIEFYWRYRNELGIDAREISKWLSHRESRKTTEHIKQGLTEVLGDTCLKVGTGLKELGEAGTTARTRLERTGLRLQGFDPVLHSEESDEQEGNRKRTFENRLKRKGETMVERGFRWLETPLVNWKLESRSAVPLTGISPSLRKDRPVTDRWFVITMLGAAAMLAAAVGALNRSGTSIVFTLLLSGAVTSLGGIFISTLLRSLSVAEILRLGYAVPLFIPFAVWNGSSTMYPPLSVFLLPLLGSVGFFIYTSIVGRLGTPRSWALEDVSNSYRAVHEPLTILGMLGSMSVALAVSLAAFGPSHPMLELMDPVTRVLFSCGICAVGVDSSVRIYRGGVLGVVAGGVLIGYLFLIGHTIGGIPSEIIVGSDILLLWMMVLVGGIAWFIVKSRNRSLRISLLMIGGGSFVLVGVAYAVARSTGAPQMEYVLRPELVGYGAVALSVITYVIILVIEWLAVRHTIVE